MLIHPIPATLLQLLIVSMLKSLKSEKVVQRERERERERESELERKFAIDLIPQTLKND